MNSGWFFHSAEGSSPSLTLHDENEEQVVQSEEKKLLCLGTTFHTKNVDSVGWA